MTKGWRCAVCGTSVDIATPLPWRCPKASASDPFHVLHLVDDEAPPNDPMPDAIDAVHPVLRYADRSAWWAYARAHGMTRSACETLVHEVVPDVRVTPFDRSAELSRAVGCDVWVKDETGNVGGSHKSRHLAGIVLHLRAAESLGHLDDRPPLAIASCGNAALAAATLAARIDWPLDVYVPTWMDDAFGRRLDALGARIHRCERRDDDPPGDPAMLRFREARDAGAIPFTVQGPENALCLDTGRTLGWEVAEQALAAGVVLDRAVAQVGGGAFAACLGAALGNDVRLDAVQAAGCAPLAAAWQRVVELDRPADHWAEVMRPWPDPQSVADGILDDDTYDWLAVVTAMTGSGGAPIVAPESLVVEAHQRAIAAGFAVSPTGSAGLAGAMTVADELGRSDAVLVVLTGAARP